jgi:hypothetical protein
MDVARHFMSARVFEAAYREGENEQSLVLEQRVKWPIWWELLLFTVIGDQPVYANSVQALLLSQPTWESLRIPHNITVLLDGERKAARMHEIFSSNAGNIEIRLLLAVEGEDKVYETQAFDTLQEARRELDELVGFSRDLWLQVCSECTHSTSISTGGGWDEHEEHGCNRDAPLATRKNELLGGITHFEGTYDFFVHAFHTCAAWRPSRLNTDG